MIPLFLPCETLLFYLHVRVSSYKMSPVMRKSDLFHLRIKEGDRSVAHPRGLTSVPR